MATNKRINIHEIDLTTTSNVALDDDVVFIPGFVNTKYIDSETGASLNSIIDAYIPTKCTTVEEFETYFGTIPAVFTETIYWTNNWFNVNARPKTGNMFNAGDMDPGYVYAKELLNMGLPIVYVRCNPTQATTTVAHMYEILSGSGSNELFDLWTELQDVGEYTEIKYLTTGGYPSFEYVGSASTVYFSSSTDSYLFPSTTATTTTPTSRLSYNSYFPTNFKTSCNILWNSDATITPTEDIVVSFMYQYPRTIANENYATETELRGGSSESTAIDEKLKYLSDEVLTSMYFYLKDQSYTTSTTKGEVVQISITAATDSSEKQYNVNVVDGWKCWWLLNKDLSYIMVPNATLAGNNTSKESGTWEYYGFGLTINSSTEWPDLTPGTVMNFMYTSSVSTGIVDKMLQCANNRGDCVALIDHTDNPYRSVNPLNAQSVYYSVSNTSSKYCITSKGTFGSMFTPWCYISTTTSLGDVGTVPATMPGSFVYLKALATSINAGYGNWLAIAGRNRGAAEIQGLSIDSSIRFSSTIAENYQLRDSIAINPIVNIKPYGYLIWGNRTLKNNALMEDLTATSFLNTRNMISDIKKLAFMAARNCMFEQDSDLLWIKFKGLITPLLDEYVSGEGLSDYSMTKEVSTERAKVVCVITIKPLYAVESFDITVAITDDTVTVE